MSTASSLPSAAWKRTLYIAVMTQFMSSVGFAALMGMPATFVLIGVLSLAGGLAAWAYLPKANLASG